MKKRSGQGLGAYGRTTILPPTFSMFFFQKATEYQLQKCGKAIFDMHLIVLKSSQSFLGDDFASNYVEIF